MAELAGLPIPRMDWSSTNAPQAFKKFKSLCQLYFTGPLKGKSEEEQVSYLLILSGEEGIELVSTWSLTADEKKQLSTYWEKFEDFVAPRSNFRLARYKLLTLKQETGESVDSFLKKVRILVNECKYTNPDEHIIDALIFGSNNPRSQSKLLEYDATLTLNKAVGIARTQEATSTQLQDIRGGQITTVDALRQQHGRNTRYRAPNMSTPPAQGTQGEKCGNCGTFHDPPRRSCPAYGTKCDACGKLGHWRSVCRSRPRAKTSYETSRGKQHRPQQGVHAIDTTEPNTDYPTVQNIDVPHTLDTPQLYFHSLHIDSVVEGDTQALLQLEVNAGQRTMPLLCKIDTGAEGNVIPVDTYKQLYPQSAYSPDGAPLGLCPSNTTITAFGGHTIQHYGTCELNLSHNGHSKPYPFHVVNTTGPTILGLPTCRDMKLVTLNYSLTTATSPEATKPTQKPPGDADAKKELLIQYKDCFTGVGCFQGEFHITLDPTVPPVIHPPRRVPEALREPLKRELDALVQQGIITKVDEPTDWVNSLVCVTKSNGTLRLCLDPKDLNRAIKRPHHRTPTLDEVLPRLSGAKYFSIVDARSGYWNIQLDHESSLCTTFNSPHGRYRFLRLPFGLICAQDIFQKKVDEAFGDLPGVTGIADDIVIYGRDQSEHDANLRAVMERARETGLRFNPDKCKIRCTEIPFFGNIISDCGLRPDPQKTKAITNMDPSASPADLQTFLGMVQFLSRFVPNLASLSANLWDLTKKSSDFQWGPEHQSAVDKIKKAVTSTSSLQYFDSTKPVTIQVDASMRGLGATLFQDKGPIEYRSKLLTATETRYSNIEREMLAIVHGLEKFHYYAYGRHVIVETDHKPLEAIFRKHLSSSPPRIARMMLRIQKYDAEIKYVPGKNVPLADALSRISPLPGDTIEGLDVSVHELHLHLNATPTRINEIKEETTKDELLLSLRAFITQGWPDTRSECPAHLHAYWNYRDELTVADGIILKGTRIIIPKRLQPAVLQQLHYAHQGAEKCKLHAKGSVFWANINRDIEEMVKGCAPCQHNQNMNVKEPLMPHDVPQKPWHTLGSDLFFWNNSPYLLVSDYYSKFPLVRKLNNIRSDTTIANLKSIFEEHDIPSKLVTGNDAQFTSAIFQEFSSSYGFVHTTTSPYFPQANGFIERTVQTVKNLLQKCKESGADPHLAMLCLRSTPLDHSISSPAELLNSRVYQANLPTISKPSLSLSADGDTNSKLQTRLEKQQLQYDKTSKPLPAVHPGDPVRVFNPHSHKWEPGVVRRNMQTPRSHLVDMANGSVRQRNRRHIRPTGEPITLQNGSDVEAAEPPLAPQPETCTTSPSAPSNESTPTSEQTTPTSLAPSPATTPGSLTGKATGTLRRSTRVIKPPVKLNL